MKCKYCHKTIHSIAHYGKMHQKQLRAARARSGGRRRASHATFRSRRARRGHSKRFSYSGGESTRAGGVFHPAGCRCDGCKL